MKLCTNKACDFFAWCHFIEAAIPIAFPPTQLGVVSKRKLTIHWWGMPEMYIGGKLFKGNSCCVCVSEVLVHFGNTWTDLAMENHTYTRKSRLVLVFVLGVFLFQNLD